MKKKTVKFLAGMMCLMTAVAFMPTVAFASGTEELEVEPEAKPAKDIEVKVTVSNKGVLAKDKNNNIMANRVVTVSDIDKDGKIVVDEALIATHDEYTKGGAAANYNNGGGFVKKLWGEESTNNMFFVNGQGLANGVLDDTISDGDKLYASINKDSVNWADWYTDFNENEKSVDVNEPFNLSLKGCQGMAFPYDPTAPVKDVKIGIWKNGSFCQLNNKKTDENGEVTISFISEGTYYVTAFGTVKDQVGWSEPKTEADCPIMAPVCAVTVKHNIIGHKKVNAGNLKNGCQYDICEKCGNVNYTVIPGWSTSYLKSFKVSKGKKAFTAKWKKQSKKNRKKFSGYQVRYSTSSKMTNAKTVNVSKNSKSKKIKKLAKKKTYYVQARSYVTSGGVKYYAGWSKVKSVKTK